MRLKLLTTTHVAAPIAQSFFKNEQRESINFENVPDKPSFVRQRVVKLTQDFTRYIVLSRTNIVLMVLES